MTKEDIEEYCKIAEDMKTSSALEEFSKIKMKYSAHFNTNPDLSSISIEQINSDKFTTFLTDFRKIYMVTEKTSFNKIIGSLISATEDQIVLDFLKKMHNSYNDILRNAPQRMLLKTKNAKEAFSADEIIRIILYGKIFHRDEKYKKIYDEMEKSAMLSMAIFALQILIVDLSAIIITLSNYIKDKKLISLL